MHADHRPGGHLDDEQLAAFVDGALDADERAAVELHLAACDPCRLAFGEIVRTVEGLEAEAGTAAAREAPAPVVPLAVRRATARRLVYAAGGLAAAAALVLAVWVPRQTARSDRPELEPLVAAVGAGRPFEPRLTGGFPHSSVQSSSRGGGDEWPSAEVRIVLGEYQRALDGSPKAEAAYGAAALLAGEVELAVRRIKGASTAEPSNAALWSDLAAALLVQHSFDSTRFASSLGEALEAAERAVRLAPSRPEAHFNRALALERLGAVTQAVEAWKAFVTVERDPGWRGEGEERLRRLQRLDESRRSTPVSEAWTAEAIGHDPWAAHRAARGDLLSAWAASAASGAPEAVTYARHLCAARATLARLWGDPPIAAADCELALSRHGSRTLRAVRQTTQAWERLESDDPAGAAALFAQASSMLPADTDVARDSAVGWARALVRSGQVARARALLVQQLETATREGRRSQQARVRHLLAYVMWQDVQPAAAIRELVEAGQLFAAAGDHTSASQTRRSLAECYRRLGATDLAWQEATLSLAGQASAGPLNTYLASYEISLLAQSSGHALAAFTLQEEALEWAKRTALEGAISEALIRRAELLADLGEVRRASADITAARELPLSSRDSYLHIELELAAARLDVSHSVDRLRALGAGGDRIEPHHRVRLAQMKARGLRALGRQDEAIAELDAAIEAASSIHSHRLEADLQYRYSQTVADVFGERLAAGADRGDDVARLFAVHEQSRHVRASSAADRLTTLRELQQRLPPGAVYLSFVIGRAFVGAFVVSQADARLGRISSTPEELAELIGRCARQLGTNPVCAAKVGDVLLSPLAAVGGAASTLVVAPDGPVRRVSFAALVDARTNRQLLDDITVVYAPSATAWVRAALKRRQAPSHTLAVGYGGVPAGFAHLRPLPSAEREAVAIARRYPSARVLVGADATAGRILADLAGAGILHFSGHALAGGDQSPLASLVVAADASDDGLLTSRAFEKIDVSALGLVTLSGCSTGDDAAGLSIAATLAARGVRAIVATLWEIDDELAHDFFVEFHRRVAAREPIQDALRATQRTLVTARREGWPAFVMVGVG